MLASATVNGFQIFSDDKTYVTYIQTYPDGTRLVEMAYVVSPLPPDISIQVSMYAPGVTFDDGTTTRIITASNFDALGCYKIRFLIPPTAKTSVCHISYLRQGTETLWSN